jgi:hypothetical protein
VRLISQSEAGKALECQADWDFRYGGTLAGSALKPRLLKPVMDDGTAWGRAIAAWHAAPDPRYRYFLARTELEQALVDIRAERAKLGLPPDLEGEADRRARLEAILHDHDRNRRAPALRIEAVERRLVVPIPAPGPAGWALDLYIDLVSVDEYGTPGIVENKLRTSLTSGKLVVSRQVRWYAWAWREVYGKAPRVIVDERKNGVPSPGVTLKQDGTPAKRQSCGLAEYLEACRELGLEPNADTVRSIERKRWHARHELYLTPDELDDAGREVASAALLILDLEAGRWPIRNAGRRCGGCFYRYVCNDPRDSELVDALFVRRPSKREIQARAAMSGERL